MMALEVSGVRKSFSGTPVLRGVGLQVPPGTLTAVLGASGAGKTTLLRIIGGFEAADAGVVTLGGTVVDDGRRRVPPERRRIGFVPQDGALFPHLTVRANAAFALPRRARGTKEIDEILGLVGLADLGSRYPSELSGGQQQRVAIARALASKPKLVLLDEPFASLDASLRSAVRADVLRVLRDTGSTAVLVTHDQDEALSVADLVAVLRDGVITQCGPPREVYQCPADPWTATFLGTANLMQGKLDDGGVRTALGWHELNAEQRSDAPAPGGGPGVMVLIRPEQVRLAAPAPGVLTGQVSETRYHGHDALVEVSTPDAGLVRVRTVGTRPPDPGEEVCLTVAGPVVAWPVALPGCAQHSCIHGNVGVMRLGVLDVGSNTVHLLVVDAYPGARPMPAFSHKSELSLAAHLEAGSKLSELGESRLCAVVEEALRVAEDKGVEDLIAFATSAVRDAVNGDEVLARIKEKTGANITVLPGEDEARLTFLAARRWFGWSSGRLLVVDIGGGSLEVAAGLDEEPETVISLPLGAGRLTRDWLAADPPTSAEVRQMRRHVRAEIARLAGTLLRHGAADHVVGTSKTFRQLSRIGGSAPSGEGPYVRRLLKRSDVAAWAERLPTMNPAERVKLPGVSARRTPQLPAGAVVADAVMDLLDVSQLEICPWALREGVILRRLDTLTGPDA